MTKRSLKPRTRCGSWPIFERRFEPLPAPDHDLLWNLHQLPKDADPHHWWTVVDCDGKLYATPGFRFVNRFAYIQCRKPWTEIHACQPDYRYD